MHAQYIVLHAIVYTHSMGYVLYTLPVWGMYCTPYQCQRLHCQVCFTPKLILNRNNETIKLAIKLLWNNCVPLFLWAWPLPSFLFCIQIPHPHNNQVLCKQLNHDHAWYHPHPQPTTPSRSARHCLHFLRCAVNWANVIPNAANVSKYFHEWE